MWFFFLSIQRFAVCSWIQHYLFFPLLSVPSAPPTAVQPAIHYTASPFYTPPSADPNPLLCCRTQNHPCLLIHAGPQIAAFLFSQNKQPLYYRCCTRFALLLFILKPCILYMSLSVDRWLAGHSRTVKVEILSRHLFVFYVTKSHDDCAKKQL
jgi:hypothetical protein